MNPRTKQMKVKQPNVQDIDGIGPRAENGTIPARVVAVGRTSEVKSIALANMRTDHWRKGTVSDDHTKESVGGLI